MEHNMDDRKRFDVDVELSDLPDMITYDDDPNIERAKMPCGHAIGPDSLTAFCRSLLTAGKYQFRCPYIDTKENVYCGYVWEYFIIRRLAVLSEDEKKEFETKLSQNYIRKASGIQECPKCKCFCIRENRKDRRVICLMCSKGGSLFEFCWNCLGEWKTSGITNCGNSACTGEDPRLKILRNADKKTIVGLSNCPSIRACPKCSMLINHEKACKHMVCICGQKFCFICLKTASSNGNYQCGTYNSHCEIAPVQTKFDTEADDTQQSQQADDTQQSQEEDDTRQSQEEDDTQQSQEEDDTRQSRGEIAPVQITFDTEADDIQQSQEEDYTQLFQEEDDTQQSRSETAPVQITFDTEADDTQQSRRRRCEIM